LIIALGLFLGLQTAGGSEPDDEEKETKETKDTVADERPVPVNEDG